MTTAFTAMLAGLLLINVGYPLRPILGLDGHDGSVWASTYYDAWGGPTLAGAWAVHGMGAMLIVFPPLAWAIRGLLRAQAHLTGTAPAPAVAAGVVSTPTRTAWPIPLRAGARGRRTGVIAAVLVSVYALALVAHAVGIGDNMIWLPRDFRSGLALAVVLTPVVAAALTARTWWRPASVMALDSPTPAARARLPPQADEAFGALPLRVALAKREPCTPGCCGWRTATAFRTLYAAQ